MDTVKQKRKKKDKQITKQMWEQTFFMRFAAQKAEREKETIKFDGFQFKCNN